MSRRLFIQGVGGLGLGGIEGTGTVQLEDIPIKDYAKPALRRRYGRVAKLMTIAAKRALEDSGAVELDKMGIVTATAMGEANVTLELLSQIRETRGKAAGAALVANSVHNAPAGHLTIALGIQGPAVTVSQGWLSGHAALAAAADLVFAGLVPRVLAVCGDEVDLRWIRMLEDAGAESFAEALERCAFKESAAALVLSAAPGPDCKGSVVGGVVRCDDSSGGIAAALEGAGIRRDREGEGAAASPLGMQAGSLGAVVSAVQKRSLGELLVLHREADELGYTHYRPETTAL